MCLDGYKWTQWRIKDLRIQRNVCSCGPVEAPEHLSGYYVDNVTGGELPVVINQDWETWDMCADVPGYKYIGGASLWRHIRIYWYISWSAYHETWVRIILLIVLETGHLRFLGQQYIDILYIICGDLHQGHSTRYSEICVCQNCVTVSHSVLHF